MICRYKDLSEPMHWYCFVISWPDGVRMVVRYCGSERETKMDARRYATMTRPIPGRIATKWRECRDRARG